MERQLKVHTRFFDIKRVSSEKKDVVSKLRNEFIAGHGYQKTSNITLDYVSGRRHVMTESSALEHCSERKEGKKCNGMEKLNRGSEVIVSEHEPKGHEGNFFMHGIGKYGQGKKGHNGILNVLDIIYKVTSKNSEESLSDARRESNLARLFLVHLRNGEAIGIDHLKQYNLYFYTINNGFPDMASNTPILSGLNHILVLTGVKEITRRMHGSKVKLPLSIAYLQGLILVADGHLRMKDLFDKDARYGIPTARGLESKIHVAKQKIENLNSLYQEKYPDQPLISREDFHQFLLDGYGGSDDSDGDEYLSDDDLPLVDSQSIRNTNRLIDQNSMQLVQSQGSSSSIEQKFERKQPATDNLLSENSYLGNFSGGASSSSDSLHTLSRELRPTVTSVAQSSSSLSSSNSSSTNSSFEERKLESKMIATDLSSLRKPTLTEIIPQFKQKLASLCEDNHYKFTLERSSKNRLLIRVVADTVVWADSRKIKSHLEPAVDLLHKMIISANFTSQQFKTEVDLDMGSLVIAAEPAILNQIVGLLQEAGSIYFSSNVSQVKAALFYNSNTIGIQSQQDLSTSLSVASDSREGSIITCAMQ